MARYRNIVVGPSKFDLMLALFDGDSNHRRKVAFQIEDPKAKQGGLPCTSHNNFVINEVRRGPNSEEEWLFTASYSANDIHDRVRGFFSTRTRKGWMELL